MLELIYHVYEQIGVNVSFNQRYYAYHAKVWLGTYAVLRKACFLPM